MNTNINLLEDKKNKQAFLASHKSHVFRYVGIGLLFLVSVSSIILFILISLSPLPNLKIQERLANTTLSQSKTQMAKMFLINERTGVASMILTSRRSYDQPLDIIQSMLPNGVDVEALIIEKNTVSMTVSSTSLALLNTFVSNLTGVANEKKAFSQISLGSLVMVAERNTYLVTMTFLLP